MKHVIQEAVIQEAEAHPPYQGSSGSCWGDEAWKEAHGCTFGSLAGSLDIFFGIWECPWDTFSDLRSSLGDIMAPDGYRDRLSSYLEWHLVSIFGGFLKPGNDFWGIFFWCFFGYLPGTSFEIWHMEEYIFAKQTHKKKALQDLRIRWHRPPAR